MTSFLNQVARYYASATQLEDYCFVFPNRRGGKFFEQELSRAISRPAMMPRVMAMTDFLSELTGHTVVGQLEALLVLYEAYARVMGDAAATMDAFVRWGNLIINDFNDADMNLVDIRQLYGNLSDLRAISTDYLDPELKRDIERVLNIRLPLASTDDHFWREPWQRQADDGEVRNSFFSLWERLHDIYQCFHTLLAEQGLHTIGQVYRDAARLMTQVAADRLPETVVMVGFSSLSVSEMAVFKSLRQRGMAHFWWDNALDVLAVGGGNPAGHLVTEYTRMFPMPEALEPVSLSGKQVQAVGVPSDVGQAKWAFHSVDEMIGQGLIPDPDNAINTAIVVPDEGLFIPLVNSVSPNIGHFNVTMGYPLRHANIASLMSLVARAHRQASRRGGEWTFFREDVKDIMSHPIVKTAFTREAMRVNDHIAHYRPWNLSASWLCQMGFDTLFTPLSATGDSREVLAYLDRLIDFCRLIDSRVRLLDAGSGESGESDDDAHVVLPLQSAFIVQYIDALEQMKLAFALHGVPVADDTLFFLIDRLTQSFVVPFEGEPVRGLQVMGAQETRSLDFENLIVLSMNERTFPRRHGIASLIPDDLRAAFYMLTGSRQDTIAAYDFYRLISRASNIVLIYNTSTSGIGSSEPSRFVTQLQLLYADRINFSQARVDTGVTSPGVPPITVSKADVPMHDYVTPSVMQDQKNANCLSHSSINEFIECPLKFYFHHVEHLSDNNEQTDFMDHSTFGTIIHDTLQALYGRPNPIVTAQDIKDFKYNGLTGQIEHFIKKHFTFQDPDDPRAYIAGEALILQETLETYARRVLDYDLQLLERERVDCFKIVECEKSHKLQLEFEGDGQTVCFNFTYKPDRVDRVNGRLRMVDYKTGREKTDFKVVRDLFEGKERRKAILQLMLYCNAWHKQYPDDKLIEPVIYRLRKIDETGVKRNGKQFVFDAEGSVNADFKRRMCAVIGKLIDRQDTFGQADEGSKVCGYCRFADFCRR